MSLDRERKPEYPEENYAYKEKNMQTPQRKAPTGNSVIDPGTFLLWGDENNLNFFCWCSLKLEINHFLSDIRWISA